MGFRIAKCCNCFNRIIVDDTSERTVCDVCNKEFDTQSGLDIFGNLDHSSSVKIIDTKSTTHHRRMFKEPFELTTCGNGSFVVSNNTLIKCNTDKDVVEIPYGIRSIGNSAFKNCFFMKTVLMPCTVEHIDDYAFYGCCNLKDVSFSESLNYIGESAFEGCKSIEQIILPDCTREISDNAFRGCSSLKKLVLGKGLNKLSKTAFVDSSVTELFLASDLNTYAFKDMQFLTSVVIGERVKKINKYMFSGSDKLKSVVFGNSVELIDSFAFSKCRELETVKFGMNLTRIANNAFAQCVKLKNFDLPPTLENIDSAAFSHCESITEMVLPESLHNCGQAAFEYCINLSNLTVSRGVKKICEDAFKGCTNLDTVSIFDANTIIDDSSFSTCKVTNVPACPPNLRKLFNFAKFIDKSADSKDIEKSYKNILDVYSFDLCREVLEAQVYESRIYLRFKNEYDVKRAAFELIESSKIFDIPFFAHLKKSVVIQIDYPAVEYPESNTLIVIYKL